MDPISFVYALTSVAIGLTVGIMAYKGRINNLWRAVVVGLVVALVAAVVSTPLNVIFWVDKRETCGEMLCMPISSHMVSLFGFPPSWMS